MLEIDLKIHVITTQMSLKRRQEFHSRHAFLEYEWFEAVTPKDFSREDLVASKLIESSMNWRLSSIANALSHKQLWEKSIALNQNLLILEDDAVLADNFLDCVTSLLNEIGDDFDFLLLGFNWDRYVFLEMFPGDSGVVKLEFKQPALQNEIDIVRQNTVRTNAYNLISAFGNCGYVISPKGAALMIEGIYPLGERLVKPRGANYEFHAQSKDALMCNVYGETSSFVAFPPLVYVKNNHNESMIKNGP